MKYTLHIDIDLPRSRVIELFDDPDNLKYWQKGFVSFTPQHGALGAVGSTAFLRYDINGQQTALLETITSSNLPDEFSATYETNGVWNHIHNRFEERTPEQTRWVFDCEFRFTGLMMRIFAFLRPGTFRKQSYSFMEKFKAFAENEKDVV